MRYLLIVSVLLIIDAGWNASSLDKQRGAPVWNTKKKSISLSLRYMWSIFTTLPSDSFS